MAAEWRLQAPGPRKVFTSVESLLARKILFLIQGLCGSTHANRDSPVLTEQREVIMGGAAPRQMGTCIIEPSRRFGVESVPRATTAGRAVVRAGGRVVMVGGWRSSFAGRRQSSLRGQLASGPREIVPFGLTPSRSAVGTRSASDCAAVCPSRGRDAA